MSLRTCLAALLTPSLCLIAGACDGGGPERVRGLVERGNELNVAAPAGTTPSDPTAPVDDPTEPVDPTDPIDPTEPVDDPTDPVDDPVGPLACPAGVVCVDTFPYLGNGDTTLGTSQLDNYACAPTTDESGPENVYRVELATAGLLVAKLDGLPAGVDVDVHILSAAASPDANRCVDRGHWNAAAWLPAGVAWVVVDSWTKNGVPQDGPYSLSLGFTAPPDFESQDLDSEVLEHALKAFALAWQDGDSERFELTVIDFSLHSIHPRLWTIDVADGSLLFKQRVSHGEGSADASDPGWAVSFSNVEGSHQSSLGLMRTAARYMSGSNGLSLRLDGLEDGINDQVRSRAIVIHSDLYAADRFAENHGRMGLSWGCQVIDPDQIEAFVDTVEGGSLLYSWYPDDDFIATSTYLY